MSGGGVPGGSGTRSGTSPGDKGSDRLSGSVLVIVFVILLCPLSIFLLFLVPEKLATKLAREHAA